MFPVVFDHASNAELRPALATAEIVITATAAQGALFPSGWVRAGTHISAMGADTRGKQELDIELVARSRLFADVVEQALQDLAIGALALSAAEAAGRVQVVDLW